MKRIVLSLMAVLLALPALAQDLTLAQEQQARDLGRTLRCVVCQNESIEESNAELAADMRRIVRDRLAEGETPEQVRAYMRDRYGDYVLLKPPVQHNTLVLWFAPALLVAGMALWLFRGLMMGSSPRTAATAAPLTEDERARLEALRR